MKKYLISILGATALGKTNLSIQIAKKLNTEIISCDSRQFFQEMKIGTSPPTTQELQKVKHHFIGNKSITENYDVGQYENEAIETLEKIFLKNKFAVMVGGSGLYSNAVMNGLDEFPDVKPQVREELNHIHKTQGIKPLLVQLEKLDIDYFYKVDKQNPQRVIRALEVCISMGKPFSSFRKKEIKKRPFEIIKIGLNMPRENLYNRINQRVDIMMQEGLLQEVKFLLPYEQNNALQTVGYKELFNYLKSNCSLEFAIEEIKKNTRRYAKRQFTWFRKDKEIQWFEPQEYDEIMKYIFLKVI